MNYTKITVKSMASNEDSVPSASGNIASGDSNSTNDRYHSSDDWNDDIEKQFDSDDLKKGKDVDGNAFVELPVCSDDDDNIFNEDENSGIMTNKELFANLPSVADAARSMYAVNTVKKTLKRRLSKRRQSSKSFKSFPSQSEVTLNDGVGLSHEDVIEIIEAEEGQNKIIKSMGAPMVQKRTIMRMNRARQKSEMVRNYLSCWKLFKLRIAMGWKRFRDQGKEWFLSLQLWRSSLKEVEGTFGNGVLSYFVFLKSLFWMNIVILLVEMFIVIPQALINSDVLKDFKPIVNSTPPVQLPDYVTNQSIPVLMGDFFTGQGYINTTIMFYSNYYGKIVVGNSNLTYNMPLAYIMVGGAYMIVSLLIMVRNFSERFTESILENTDSFYSYCNKIFASWDYCITSENAATLKKNIIFNDFCAELAEEKRLFNLRKQTKCDRFKIFLIRLACNILVLSLLAASIYAIIKAVGVSTNFNKATNEHSIVIFLKRWTSSLTISVLNLILPSLFELLTTFESYSPRVAVAMSLWRAVVLKLASVGVLIITLYAKYREHSCDQCWENQVAAQMFNLIIVDFVVVVAVTIFMETSRKYAHRYLDLGCKLGEKIGRQEFQIPKNVLDLVYGQSLIWIGAFFAPLIPVLGIIKLFIIFYVKKISLMFNCKSSVTYQGARSNYFITLLLLLTFLLCTIAIGYGVARVPSSKCGPYSNFDCNPSKHMIDIIEKTVGTWPQWIQSVFDFVKTTVFLFPLFIIIFLLLYYYHSMTTAHEKMIELLQAQLKIEGRDKRFLMDRVIKATKLKEK